MGQDDCPRGSSRTSNAGCGPDPTQERPIPCSTPTEEHLDGDRSRVLMVEHPTSAPPRTISSCYPSLYYYYHYSVPIAAILQWHLHVLHATSCIGLEWLQARLQ